MRILVKTRGRLIADFLTLALVGLVIGIVGMLSMDRLSRLSERLVRENTEPLGRLIDVFDTAASLQILVRDVVLFAKPEDVALYRTDFKARYARLRDALEGLKLRVVDPGLEPRSTASGPSGRSSWRRPRRSPAR